MARSVDPQKYLSAQELARVQQAVTDAERRTSAEIRVILTRFCFGDITRKAEKLFHRHGMDKTNRRNAALIMLVTTNREFIIYGDEGIDQHVGVDGWTAIAEAMLEHFQADRIGDGLCAGARLVGEQLAQYFPIEPDDVNELPDEVIAHVE